ncbi:putative ER to Golgi transport-related protein [Mycena leptocephala]|nr:putative ER to Golgi transport-related protein [Mycena leptocephala]
MSVYIFYVSIAAAIATSYFEEHHINKMDLCNQLNKPEHLAPAFLASVFLISRNWMAFMLNAPMAAYNVKKEANLIRNKNHLFDVGEMKFRRVPWKHRKESFIETGFYLLSFFFYLYSMIVAFIADGQ